MRVCAQAWSSDDNQKGRKLFGTPRCGVAEHSLASFSAYMAAPIAHFISSEMLDLIKAL